MACMHATKRDVVLSVNLYSTLSLMHAKEVFETIPVSRTITDRPKLLHTPRER